MGEKLEAFWYKKLDKRREEMTGKRVKTPELGRNGSEPKDTRRLFGKDGVGD